MLFRSPITSPKLSARGGLGLRGWLARLGDVIGLDEIVVEGEMTATPSAVPRGQAQALEVRVPGKAGLLACLLHPLRAPEATLDLETPAPGSASAPHPLPDLALPISSPASGALDHETREGEADLPSRVWRVVPRSRRPGGPAWVVGKLVHEALRRWRFPSEDNFDVFLWPFALEAGLTDAAEIQATLNEARRLLNRFQAHPLCAEMGSAVRYHEVPYALAGDSGVIDMLYRSDGGWTIVDFKTDELRSLDEMRETIRNEGYDAQVRRYADAVAAQLGQRPRARLVFLRVAGEVQVIDLPSTQGE